MGKLHEINTGPQNLSYERHENVRPAPSRINWEISCLTLSLSVSLLLSGAASSRNTGMFGLPRHPFSVRCPISQLLPLSVSANVSCSIINLFP